MVVFGQRMHIFVIFGRFWVQHQKYNNLVTFGHCLVAHISIFIKKNIYGSRMIFCTYIFLCKLQKTLIFLNLSISSESLFLLHLLPSVKIVNYLGKLIIQCFFCPPPPFLKIHLQCVVLKCMLLNKRIIIEYPRVLYHPLMNQGNTIFDIKL